MKGTVVVLLDCCQSGAFISTATQRVFGTRFIQAFAAGSSGRLDQQQVPHPSLHQRRPRIASACCPPRTPPRGNSSTAFSRSLCEAGGLGPDGGQAHRPAGGHQPDQAVTLYEAYLYCSQRVNKYLEKYQPDPGRADVSHGLPAHPVPYRIRRLERDKRRPRSMPGRGRRSSVCTSTERATRPERNKQQPCPQAGAAAARPCASHRKGNAPWARQQQPCPQAGAAAAPGR